MATLRFELPRGEHTSVEVRTLLNGGYAGRRQEAVAAHVRELAHLGVAAPAVTPTMYALPPYLAMQTDVVFASHDRTSGEGEWALVIAGPGERDVLLTAACDHTDRALEAHSVPWSKQAGPDVLGARAWRLVDIADRLDALELAAWADGHEIQRGTFGDLLPPSHWLDVLARRGLRQPGTILLSGTIPMHAGVNQFAASWRVALRDPKTGDSIECGYTVRRLPASIE